MRDYFFCIIYVLKCLYFINYEIDDCLKESKYLESRRKSWNKVEYGVEKVIYK